MRRLSLPLLVIAIISLACCSIACAKKSKSSNDPVIPAGSGSGAGSGTGSGTGTTGITGTGMGTGTATTGITGTGLGTGTTGTTGDGNTLPGAYGEYATGYIKDDTKLDGEIFQWTAEGQYGFAKIDLTSVDTEREVDTATLHYTVISCEVIASAIYLCNVDPQSSATDLNVDPVLIDSPEHLAGQQTLAITGDALASLLAAIESEQGFITVLFIGGAGTGFLRAAGHDTGDAPYLVITYK